MKAVLVIDVEEKDIGRKANYISVQGDGCSYIVGIMGMDARLRPLPHKLQADWYTDGYKEGFNACLEEITGETE